jgi:hypothetical protein
MFYMCFHSGYQVYVDYHPSTVKMGSIWTQQDANNGAKPNKQLRGPLKLNNFEQRLLDLLQNAFDNLSPDLRQKILSGQILNEAIQQWRHENLK